MARYIPVGSPVNRAEAEGLRQLRDQLPDNYIVIGNFELNLKQRRNTLEFDVVVIGDWGIYAVEIKGWSGKITGDTRRWTLRWGRVENPFIRAEGKAKALRDLLARQIDGWPDELFVEAIVHLPSKKVRVKVDDPREARLTLRNSIEDFFVTSAAEPEQNGPPIIYIDDELKERIANLLVPIATPTNALPSITNYEVLEEIPLEGLPFREFIGHHRLLRSRGKVRIKRYSLDPLIAPSERDDELARILRDMEALNTMEDNPYIARAYELIRDMEDELIFYVVTEHASATTLRDLFEQERLPLGECSLHERRERWKLAWHLTKAIATNHKRGITHRNLHPGVIYLIDDESSRVPLKIADFDFAKLGNFDLVGDILRRIVKEGYGAPEMWLAEVHDHRCDTYSVGAILFELITGTPLYAPSMALMRHTEIWELRRQLLPDHYRSIWDGLLAYDPDDRIDDISSILPFLAKQTGQFERELQPYTDEFRVR